MGNRKAAEDQEPHRGEEMARRVREFDWSTTPLGPMAGWPQSLKTIVQRAVEAPVPSIPFLLKLSDTLRATGDAVAIQEQAARLLGEHLRVTRAFYFSVEKESDAYIHTVAKDYYNQPEMPSVVGRHPQAAYGKGFFTNLVHGEILIVPDINRVSQLTGEERDRYLALDIQSLVIVPLVKDSVYVAAFAVNDSAPRAWTAEEIALIEETAERTWAAVERARSEGALRESEEKYRTLFETFDAGYCLVEVIRDENDQAVDMRYLEVNAVFERQTGLHDVAGKTHADLGLKTERHWFETYGQVARTGVATRFESYHLPTRRWYNVFVSRADSYHSDRVALVFDDVTERKQQEERQAFLLRLSDTLRPLTDAARLLEAAMKLLAEQLDVMRATYFEVEADQNTFALTARYERDPVPIPNRLRLTDFSPDLAEGYRAGRTLMVRDTESEATEEAQREAYRAIGVRAWLAVPLVKNGQLVTIVGVHSRTPRNWSGVEVQLLEDLAERTWAAVERSHAEAALRESEARHRTLFDSIDEAVCLVECLPLQLDGRRDYRFVTINPAMQAMFDIPDLSGQSVRDTFPDQADDWCDDYDRVLETGEAIRFERLSASPDRVLEIFVTRIEDGAGQQVLAVMQDVTARRRQEERQEFLLKLADALRPLADAAEIEETACRLLGEHLGVNRVYYPEVSEAKGDVRIERQYLRPGATSVAGVYPLSVFGWTLPTLRSGQAVVVNDIHNSDLLSPDDAATMAAIHCASLICVPLVKNGVLVGALSVSESSPRVWTTEETTLARETLERLWAAAERARAEAVAEAARRAVAQANDELELRVAERTQELATRTEELAEMSAMRQELLRKLVTAQEEERGRIARDLHDDTGQQIAALLLGLNNLKALPAVAAEPTAQTLLPHLEELAGNVARKSHRLSFTLRPTELDDIGLLGALENYTASWSRWSNIPAEVESLGFESSGAGRLPAEVETTIYRVVQEALTNILKYAANPNLPAETRASRVTILVRRTTTGVLSVVEDDGPGFDVEEALSRPPGQRRLGIFGMQERARLAGGTLEVESTPGSGTSIYLRLPLLPA